MEGLVYSNGTQVILDETSGVVSIVFINADGKAEIIEISDSDLSELISNRFLIQLRINFIRNFLCCKPCINILKYFINVWKLTTIL